MKACPISPCVLPNQAGTCCPRRTEGSGSSAASTRGLYGSVQPVGVLPPAPTSPLIAALEHRRAPRTHQNQNQQKCRCSYPCFRVPLQPLVVSTNPEGIHLSSGPGCPPPPPPASSCPPASPSALIRRALPIYNQYPSGPGTINPANGIFPSSGGHWLIHWKRHEH